MNILRWRSFVLFLLLGLSGVLRLKAEAVPLPVVNPSFEALTGTDPTHFDASGHLLDEHYSAFNFAFGPGFNSPDALPGWSGSGSAGTFNPTAALFPGGVPDGQNTAWINVHGSLNQTLAGKFQAGRRYRLTVDVGALSSVPFSGRALPQSPGARVVSISGGEFLAGQAKEVSVRLAASGDENALAFSVRHDPTRLRFVGADLGADAIGATLYINSLQGSDGRIGLVLALPASAKFVAGDIEVAKFRFAGLPGGTGPMDLSFSDAPVFREVASAKAEALPSLWADTVFTVASRNLSFRVVPTADGPVIELSWPTGTTTVSIESANDPVGGKWSPVVAVPVNDGASRIVTLPLSATSSYYRLVVP